MKGYKAFDKDMKCRNMQYKVGEIYKCDEAIICEKGFHFCENPLDCLNYYSLCESVFAEIQANGAIVNNKDDTKKATTKIKIGKILDLSEFIDKSIEYLINASSGDGSKLASSGYMSQLELNGNNSVGGNVGVNGKIKGVKGCWITLAEYDINYRIKYVKSVKVDGKKIKADTWYILKNGKFIETNEN